MYNNRKAFTLIELVFVLVVIGILATIAIPRLAATRNDAQIAKGRSDVAAIRAAIVSERQSRLLQGNSAYTDQLHVGAAGDKTTLFDSNGSAAVTFLQYGITTQNASDGHWDDTVSEVNGRWIYVFRVLGTDINFVYNRARGTFDCNRTVGGNAGRYCQSLVD